MIKIGNRTFYTPEEVGEIMGLHPVTVRNMFRSGQLPGHKFGGKWYISEDKLTAAIAGEIEPPAPKTGELFQD